eukprot:2344410-Rhodomonas_salina.1
MQCPSSVPGSCWPRVALPYLLCDFRYPCCPSRTHIPRFSTEASGVQGRGIRCWCWRGWSSVWRRLSSGSNSAPTPPSPAPDTRHPRIYTLDPTPSNLHPKPDTLESTP